MEFQIEVLSGSVLDPLLGQILELDRANMTPILRASAQEFPETKRLAGLLDAKTQVVVARAGADIAAYVDFVRHQDIPQSIYVSSLQVAPAYRHGMALAHVLARMGLVLREQPPSTIGTHVQRANSSALALFARLGFEFTAANPQATTLEAIAGPEILSSPLFRRLIRRSRRYADD